MSVPYSPNATSVFGYVPYYVLQGSAGPAGAAGPTGPLGGFLQNDRQGRASIQTSADADNAYGGKPIPSSLYLSALNVLQPVPYTTSGSAPFRTPLTQASILNVLTTYGDGQDELSAFEVDGLAAGTGTIELEGMMGFLVGAVQGLGFAPDPKVEGGLIHGGPLSVGGFTADPTTNFTFVNSSLTLGAYTQPVGVYDLVPTGCYYVLINDVSSPVSVVLTASAVPMGTTYSIRSLASAATHPITITDSNGATFNGASSYVISAPYTGVSVLTDGTNWFY